MRYYLGNGYTSKELRAEFMAELPHLEILKVQVPCKQAGGQELTFREAGTALRGTQGMEPGKLFLRDPCQHLHCHGLTADQGCFYLFLSASASLGENPGTIVGAPWHILGCMWKVRRAEEGADTRAALHKDFCGKASAYHDGVPSWGGLGFGFLCPESS
jgi:hypothetical protein